MKIGKTFASANFFNKIVDDSDVITEGAVKLFYPDGDKIKVGYLPAGATSYLEIEKVAENPVIAEEGEVVYNTVDSKFYLWKTDAWVEVLFSMEEVV